MLPRLHIGGFVLLLLVFACTAFAQNRTLRGSVVEKDSKYPLVGASVALFGLGYDPAATAAAQKPMGGTVTDAAGNFELPDLAVGRYTLVVSFVGFRDLTLPNVVVDAGRETVLVLELESAEALATKGEVVIHAARVGEALNEMATTSVRTFSVEETNRYAGSRGDPARMASSYAGVTGADDSRNDIVVRGNSPSGVLWRLEGVDIYNPNHFNIPGTAGGSVTVINNKYLANSDFFTGAFPADYGNSVAAAFDLRMRNGNPTRYEFSAQLGLLGTEVLAEGPMGKKGQTNAPSFLVSYRYSSLAAFGFLGIKLGTSAIPYYQDGAFRLNFPLAHNANLAVFGIGGASNIAIKISDQKKITSDIDLYGQNDRDQYFSTSTALVGAAYTQSFNSKTLLKATLAYNGESAGAYHELLFRHIDSSRTPHEFVNDSLRKLLDYTFRQSKITLGAYLTRKLSSRWLMKAGINADFMMFNFLDSVRASENPAEANYRRFVVRWDVRESGILAQPYVQFRYTPSAHLTLNLGLHEQYFSVSNTASLPEPRLGLRYDLPNRQSLTFSAGLHSQIQATYLYYYHNPLLAYGNTLYNKDMGFTKSLQTVAGYQKVFGNNFLLKAETYFQYLYDIPVEAYSTSSFSLVNTGSGFSRFFPSKLTNTGIGRNYGLELTAEKRFAHSYYFLVTASLFEAQYQGSDGIWRNTDFNAKYAANAVVAKEWVFNKRNSLNVGAKLTYTGGRWTGPVDLAASQAQREVVYYDATRNSVQLRPYFRADLKVNYKINTSRFTHEIGLDLVNLLGTQNILNLTYSPLSPYVIENYQLGRLPIFYYRIDFGVRR